MRKQNVILKYKENMEGVKSVSLRTGMVINIRNPLSDFEVRENVEIDANKFVEQEEGSREPPHHLALKWEGSKKSSTLTILTKDEAKSAQTFVVIDGERYSIPGDYATVEADGTVTLLGRGSQCINTGGEKVYPEEVEECLKLHPTVADAAVVGVPDDKWGEAITALVEPHVGDVIDAAELIAHVKARLAAYKAPKRVVTVTSIGRAANGKLDYKRLRSDAIDSPSAEATA